MMNQETWQPSKAHTPEEKFLSEKPFDQVDSLHYLLNRSIDTLILLSGQFNGSDVERVNDRIVENVLAQVEANLKMSQKIVDHWNDECRSEKKRMEAGN